MGKPILFSGPMVRAICEGRKTVTRRVVRGVPPSAANAWLHDDGWRLSNWLGSPLGVGVRAPFAVGDLLWLRETWRTVDALDDVAPRDLPDDAPIWYDADDVDHVNREGDNGYVYAGQFATESMTATIGRVRQSIFMQHRFARGIRLEVVSVRAERLHDIDDADAEREGVRYWPDIPAGSGCRLSPDSAPRWSWLASPPDTDFCFHAPRSAFANLWNTIHDGAWDANPWVWRIEFRRVTP